MKSRTGSLSLACAAVTGVLAFVFFLAGGALLWAGVQTFGWALLGLGLASVVGNALLTLVGTRPEPRSPR